MPKIVILDSHTVNPGDLSWEPFERLGELKVYPRTEPDKAYERSKDADIIITSKVPFTRELLDRLPGLKYIGIIATGLNNVDLKAAREKGIPVTNIPLYCPQSVAQMVFAHIMELVHRIGYYTKVIKEDGKWSKAPDFAFWDFPLHDLEGKTLGVIGTGNIGTRVAKIAAAFGMKIIAYDINQAPLRQIEYVDMDTLFETSDFVSLHCPLTESTKGLINKENISKMKKNAYVINTGRGPLVNEADLAEALNNSVIAGAGIDVLSVEPPSAQNPLLGAKNCFITPHIGFATKESRTRLIELTAKNVSAFLDGEAINVVNEQ